MPWRHLAYPYLDPAASVIDAVVHRGKVSGVETVLVAGAPVLRDGQIVQVAKAAVLEELATALRQPLSLEEAHRRQLARDVFPTCSVSTKAGWMNRRGSLLPYECAPLSGQKLRGKAGMPH